MVAIPPELLENPGPPLIIFFLTVALVVVWRLWRSTEDTVRSMTEKLGDQKVLVERSTALLQFREFERDQHKKEYDRCERDLDRCMRPSSGGTT